MKGFPGASPFPGGVTPTPRKKTKPQRPGQRAAKPEAGAPVPAAPPLAPPPSDTFEWPMSAEEMAERERELREEALRAEAKRSRREKTLARIAELREQKDEERRIGETK